MVDKTQTMKKDQDLDRAVESFWNNVDKTTLRRRFEKDLEAEVVVHVPNTLGYDGILHRILRAVENATESVYIRSCYVVICRPLQNALARAARRGLTVRVLSNSARTNDLLFIHAAMCRSLISLADAGADVFLTQQQMDHTKFVLVDRRWLCVGSWNAWIRTHFYEAELNLIVVDPSFGEAIGFHEFDSLVSETAVRSGRVQKYSASMLSNEADQISKTVCKPDKFHQLLI